MPVDPEINADIANAAAGMKAEPEASLTKTVVDSLLFGLSLPERLARSAVGVTAGTAKELAEFVVPQAFQDSKSYEVMVRNSLNFLMDNIAAVAPVPSDNATAGNTSAPADASAEQPETKPDNALGGRFVAKKAVGNFIDIAGLATLHVSPLWVLAIVSDAAYGTTSYLQELASELQKQGLIDDSSTIHKVDDLFAAVKQASGRAASQFDQPPLSLEELKTSYQQTRDALLDVDPTLLIPESEIRKLWEGMKQTATQENVSLLGVSGAVAMQTMESIRSVTHGTLTGLFVAGRIVNRNIFAHYIQSLDSIRQRGLWQSVSETYQPYVNLAWTNFTRSRKTWTEQILDPGNVGRLFRRMTGWMKSDAEPAVARSAETPDTDVTSGQNAAS
jgi:hypothetical protein